MANTTIRRHGDRWALHEGDDTTPTAEYATREEAESAARARGDYELDDTPRDEGLGAGAVGDEDGGARPRDAGIDQRTGGAGAADDTPRQDQAGF